MLAVASHTTRLIDTLSESFRESGDGFWYPIESGVPLVRVSVGGNGYQIERRRNDRCPWMPIVTANVAEFDPTAFRVWRSNWKAVQAR